MSASDEEIAVFIDRLADAFGDSAFEVVPASDGGTSIVARDVPAWLRARAEGLRNYGADDIIQIEAALDEERRLAEQYRVEREQWDAERKARRRGSS